MPAKQKGAPASASKRERQPVKRTGGKPTRVGKLFTREEKLAKSVAAQQAANDEIQLAITMRAEKRSPGGQPFPYTDALGAEIHDLLVTGLSVMKVAKRPGMPCDVTMFKWIGDPKHPFSELYRKAKQLMVARFEEEIQDIADEEHIGEIHTDRQALTAEGDVVTLTEVRRVDSVEHRKLRIAARQWTLSHLMPKKHGRLPAQNDGEGGSQLEALFQALKVEAQ
jgi:hypothetical protein